MPTDSQRRAQDKWNRESQWHDAKLADPQLDRGVSPALQSCRMTCVSAGNIDPQGKTVEGKDDGKGNDHLQMQDLRQNI